MLDINQMTYRKWKSDINNKIVDPFFLYCEHKMQSTVLLFQLSYFHPEV